MTKDFASRFGYERPSPERNLVEQDSPRLRALIWRIVSNSGTAHKSGYQAICQVCEVLPDTNVWGDESSREAGVRIVDDLHWTDVYEVLENLYSQAPSTRTKLQRPEIEDEVNEALARSGLAYQMRMGQFEMHDPEGEKLGIAGAERTTLDLLEGEFVAVRVQYQKAVSKLHAIPADLEGAMADAVNSLEAVTGIVTGKSGRTLGETSKLLFPNGEGYHQPLRDAISKLYGYSSAVPGVRHGRYAEPVIARAESIMVVRIVGAVITFLITDFHAKHPTATAPRSAFSAW